MSQVNFSNLLPAMLDAAKTPLQEQWESAGPYAATEFKNFTESLANIALQKLDGSISEAEAKLLVSMQQESMKTVLLAVKGMSLVAVESAINAALGVIKDTVNTAIGFRLF